MQCEFQQGGALYAVFPKIPVWESFAHSSVLDWCAFKSALGSQFIQGLSLVLNVQIREWGWEVETTPQNIVPQRSISAYGSGQKLLKSRVVAKETPFEVIIVLYYICPRTELRHNAAHPLHCKNKEMKPQITLNREGTGVLVELEL